MISAVIPQGAGHLVQVVGISFSDEAQLLSATAFWWSLFVDFLVRVKGGNDLTMSVAKLLPIPQSEAIRASLSSRALRSVALSTAYVDLWNRNWPQVASAPAWSSSDPRLTPFPAVSATWHRSSALRNHFERRWALVEIDALAALELKLTIDELCTIYRTQFPVLREYEKNTWYDRKGRIAFTTNRGLTGVGLERKDFELWQSALKAGTPLPSDFDRQSLVPPFDVRDREEDMRTAYSYFSERLASPTPPIAASTLPPTPTPTPTPPKPTTPKTSKKAARA
jgi:hypothetical protein